jgi:hypothetical protein
MEKSFANSNVYLALAFFVRGEIMLLRKVIT